MKKQITLEIKKPCLENYDNFTPTEKGGFCASCEKEVIDFTTMKREEIITYFKNNSTHETCGRLNNHQLQIATIPTKNRSMITLFKGMGLAFLSLFLSGNLHAQEVNKQAKNSNNKLTKNIVNTIEKEFVVKGNVTEDSVPLPGVNILLEGTTIGTQTDFDGNFVFPKKLKRGDVLIFSYVGFESKKIVITDEKSASNLELKVNMKLDTCVILGKIAVKKVYRSKKKN